MNLAMTWVTRPAPRMLRVATSFLFACCMLAGPALRVARAADLSPQQKQEMRVLYDKATRAYDVGKYAEAIEDYQKAYEIGGDPPMLYNIAQSYRLNNQPTEAVRFYKRYLQRAPTARNREDVERKIAEQEKIIEEQKKIQPPPPPPVTTTPGTGTPITPVPPPTTVGPPSPQPVIPAPSTTPETPVPAPAPAATSEGLSTTRLIVGLGLIGLGAVAGVVAGVEGMAAKDKSDSLTTASKMGGAIEFNPNIEKDGKNADKALIGLAIAGGVLAAAGVVVLLTGGSSEVSAEPAPVPTARANFVPWLGAGIVGAGADIRF
jgi:tetratricopeptide (TPR) repeat protein